MRAVLPPSITPCSRCGAPRTCAVEAGLATPCWCLSMPKLPPEQLTGSLSCMCPACLQAALRTAGVMPPVDGG